MKKLAVVAMSGGVDSSVTAALLRDEGYEVIGVTMCLSLPAGASEGKPNCCGAQGIADAKRVSDILGIKHYVLDFGGVFKEKVVDPFYSEYAKGRTPNPCIVCNEQVKFRSLLEKAKELGAEFLATGHYARIEDSLLAKARDPKKDQSYFLYRVAPAQLKNVRFPLGDVSKPEVRELAKKYKLPVSEKPDSQEICFTPDMGLLEKKGPIKDKGGKTLGEHKGIAFYTVGQRQGLGVSSKHPLYISRIDAATDTVYVGPKEDVYKRKLSVSDVVNYRAGDGPNDFEVKIRYLHKESAARVDIRGGKASVEFEEAQFAVTPGQSAVFYRDGKIYGGGIIETTEE